MTAHYRDAARDALQTDMPPPPRGWAQRLYLAGGKRALDLVLCALIAPFALLIVAGLAAVVAATGGHPFYAQQRVGRGGVPYRMWKLRTMVRDADDRLAACLAACDATRAEWTSTQKLKNDPRITRVGHLLRRSSLDEVPQLWNVLRGEMSLVGPRPMLPDQQALYPGQAYYTLRPGITGLWQVSHRNASQFAEVSALLDLRVMLATVRVMARGTGY